MKHCGKIERGGKASGLFASLAIRMMNLQQTIDTVSGKAYNMVTDTVSAKKVR